MPQRQKFEDYLANSPSTALLDYRLLCLGNHILHLEKHPKTGSTNAADAVELAGLYAKLVARLQRYEEELGALSQKPSSRHQNAEREQLVATFQADWQKLIAPVANKYKSTKENRRCRGISVFGRFASMLRNFFSKESGMTIYTQKPPSLLHTSITVISIASEVIQIDFCKCIVLDCFASDRNDGI